MSPNIFKFESHIDGDITSVFAWHQRPGSFEMLTPPWIQAKIIERKGGINDGDQILLEIGSGLIKFRWQLEHRNFIQDRQFQDVQLGGPFESYTHTHRFHNTENNRCVIEDTIEFQLPSIIDDIKITNRFVELEFARLFKYRKEVLQNQCSSTLKGQHPMEIAITGSHGLIGSALVPLLTTQGHTVRRMIRTTGSTECNKHIQAPNIKWTPEVNDHQDSALDGVDAIIHLAGVNIASSRWTAERKRAICDSRINLTRLLSDHVVELKKPPKVFICASAIGYYGDRGDEVLDENSEAGEGFLSKLCLNWELATTAARNAGIRVINLRFGIVLSPKGGALAKILPPFTFGMGGTIGGGTQYMSWIAIDDVIDSIQHCLTNESISGPVNMVAPFAVTNAQFTQALGKVLNRPTIAPVPDFVLRLMLGEMADELLLASAHVKPTKLINQGYHFRYPDIESALSHLLGK